MNLLVVNPPYHTPIIREGRCQSPQDMRRTSIPQMTVAYLASLLAKDGHHVQAFDCIGGASAVRSCSSGRRPSRRPWL